MPPQATAQDPEPAPTPQDQVQAEMDRVAAQQAEAARLAAERHQSETVEGGRYLVRGNPAAGVPDRWVNAWGQELDDDGKVKPGQEALRQV